MNKNELSNFNKTGNRITNSIINLFLNSFWENKSEIVRKNPNKFATDQIVSDINFYL